jgi:ribosomal protein L22
MSAEEEKDVSAEAEKSAVKASEKAPAEKKPAAKKEPAAKPAAKKPAAKAPAAEKKGAAEATAEKIVEGKGAEKKPAAKKPAAKASTTEKKPVAEKPAKEKAPAEPRPAEKAAKAPAPGAGRAVVHAHARYVRTSARKARMVCGHLRGKSVQEARAILAFTPREVARDWSKLLESAVANAENNHELLADDLIVREAYADEGPTIKRFRPRAMGRATPIRKRTSHLTITLTPEQR